MNKIVSLRAREEKGGRQRGSKTAFFLSQLLHGRPSSCFSCTEACGLFRVDREKIETSIEGLLYLTLGVPECLLVFIIKRGWGGGENELARNEGGGRFYWSYSWLLFQIFIFSLILSTVIIFQLILPTVSGESWNPHFILLEESALSASAFPSR